MVESSKQVAGCPSRRSLLSYNTTIIPQPLPLNPTVVAEKSDIEQAFDSENDSSPFEDPGFQQFYDALTQITDEVNLSVIELLGSEAQSSSPIVRKKKKKSRYYHRKFPLSRIIKNDFRKHFVTMFRNVINSADRSMFESFFTQYATPDCDFLSHNIANTRINEPIVQHRKGIQSIVNDLTNKTMHSVDYVMRIEKACIVQKEDLLGCKVMMQMQFQSTQILLPSPASLSQLDHFCTCGLGDKERMAEVKVRIEENARRAGWSFASSPAATPTNSTTNSTTNTNAEEPTNTIQMNKEAVLIVEKMQQAGVSAALQEIVQSLLTQGHRTPSPNAVKHTVTTVHAFLTTTNSSSSNNTSGCHPLAGMLSGHKLDALRQLQTMQDIARQFGGLAAHVHPVLLATMVETIRFHVPFLPSSAFTTDTTDTSTVPSPTTTTASSNDSCGNNTTAWFMDVELLLQHIQLFYQNNQNNANSNNNDSNETTATATPTVKKKARSARSHFLTAEPVQPVTFRQCPHCHKKQLPSVQTTLIALMQPWHIQVTLNPIGTCYLDTHHRLYRMESFIPRQHDSYAISFDFDK